jgi:hypothetical protein
MFLKNGVLFIVVLLIGMSLSGCKENADNKPDYQKEIDKKLVAVGGDPDNGGAAVPTKGGKGWVLYLNNKTHAIFYFPSDFSELGETFYMRDLFFYEYDRLGQDSESGLGVVRSDAQNVTSGTYHEFANGVLMNTVRTGNTPFAIYGKIYTEYLRLNRWDGPLGAPIIAETELMSRKGRYIMFQTGQIYWSESTGAHGFWAKMDQMYKTAGYDTGWLGLPLNSYDQKSYTDIIKFQNGQIKITADNCGRYMDVNSYYVFANGQRAAAGQSVPNCF